MRVDRALLVNGDGSGYYTLTIGVREPQPNDPSSISPPLTTALEAYGAQVRATGGSFAYGTSQDYATWIYTRHFASVADANTLLRENPQAAAAKQYPVLFHDTLRIAKETRLSSSAFHLTGAISLADPHHTARAWSDATESVSVTMAAGILAQQGGVRQGNTVTYSIHYNQSATIDVFGHVSGSSGFFFTAMPWLIVGVLLVLAGALAVAGILMLRRPAVRV
jgi:hypothetical protein